MTGVAPAPDLAHGRTSFCRCCRYITNASSASGIAVRYQRVHCPDLSPATSSTADRHGSNTNRMRNSDAPADGGRSSFMLDNRDDFTVSTNGRPRVGPFCFEDEDGL